MNIPAILASLKLSEGRKLTPYQDSEGHWTLGFGHKMTNPISEEAALLILKDDVLHAIEGLNRRIPSWTTHSSDIQDLLVELAFNLGINGLMTFEKFLIALHRSDYRLAKAELLNSKWAGQVGGRAARMASVFDRHFA